MSDTTAQSHPLSPAAQQVRPTIEADIDTIFDQLTDLVSFNSPRGAEGNLPAAEWVKEQFETLGFTVELVPAVDGTRVLLGHRGPTATDDSTAADAPTITLYAHYDVVPAQGEWATDPFTLTKRATAASHWTERWYGRGAADCKGNVIAHLAAIRALDELGGTRANINLIIEGSEEVGGEGLDHLIETEPERFASDMYLIVDSGNAATGVPTLTSSLRGGGQIDVTVTTLKSPAHSGSFGGPAPDAVFALIRALNSLRDEAGYVRIDGLPSDQVWEGYQYDEEAFTADAGLVDGAQVIADADNTIASQLWSRVAVSITGFTSTPVAEAVNAVPATATARVNFRVPPGLTADEVQKAICEHIAAHMPWGAHVEFAVSEAADPFSARMDGPLTLVLAESMGAAYAESTSGTFPRVEQVGMGGSIPLTTTLIEAHPHAELALYGCEDPQANIHSPNESVDPTEIIATAATTAIFLLSV
ncbi:MAG: M20/M25/M40 family metallo-hydrolase [Corynebacterium sp.]|nr:M20/M25/M40 family metallo-hydrolase [Corynebacterium sp.]